jgi:dihydrodipicolinate synthase/N-acetylneuraminate lyase
MSRYPAFRAGVNAVFVRGSTGESHSLTVE